MICSLALANENEFKIIEREGEISIRHGIENAWEPYRPGEILNENVWIKSGNNSSARIERYDGQIFILPERTIIEGMELKNYSSSEILLILTSIEISNIPSQKDKPIAPSGAYIIHGNRPTDSATIDSIEVKQYLNHEVNGLHALFDQSFWAGVILKIFKLKKFDKMLDWESLEFKLIVAYYKMNLVRRFNEAKKRFIKTYPQSNYIEQINNMR